MQSALRFVLQSLDESLTSANDLSAKVLVAGMARMLFAMRDKFGNLFWLSLQNCRMLSFMDGLSMYSSTYRFMFIYE